MVAATIRNTPCFCDLGGPLLLKLPIFNNPLKVVLGAPNGQFTNLHPKNVPTHRKL